MSSYDSDTPLFPSRAAKDSIKEDIPMLRRRVLCLLIESIDGLTDEQIQDAIPMSPNTERPRRRELVQSGHVFDSGLRRPLRSGRSGTVWVAKR